MCLPGVQGPACCHSTSAAGGSYQWISQERQHTQVNTSGVLKMFVYRIFKYTCRALSFYIFPFVQVLIFCEC